MNSISRNRTLVVFLLLLMVIPSLKAQQSNSKPFTFLISSALEFGGHSVAEVSFQDGSVQSMPAGQGGSIYAGGELQLNKKASFFLRGLVGYKFLTTKATNANITLTRIPIRITGVYRPGEKFWVSAGLVTHQAVRFNAGGLGQNASLNSILGATVELGYKMVSLSVTPMTYMETGGSSYDATGIGLFFHVPLKSKRRNF